MSIGATPARLRAAAEIWAAATAARDGCSEPAPASEAQPLIDAVLAAQGSLIVLGGEAGEVLAFATAQPAAGEEAAAEVRYVAVRPQFWGQGAGRALMRALPMSLRELGFERAWLTVYSDNARALALYEAAGWRASGEGLRHERTGKPMLRYELEL